MQNLNAESFNHLWKDSEQPWEHKQMLRMDLIFRQFEQTSKMYQGTQFYSCLREMAKSISNMHMCKLLVEVQ